MFSLLKLISPQNLLYTIGWWWPITYWIWTWRWHKEYYVHVLLHTLLCMTLHPIYKKPWPNQVASLQPWYSGSTLATQYWYKLMIKCCLQYISDLSEETIIALTLDKNMVSCQDNDIRLSWFSHNSCKAHGYCHYQLFAKVGCKMAYCAWFPLLDDDTCWNKTDWPS